MANNTTHTIEYITLSKILLVLMFLTFVTIGVTSYNLGALSVTAALLIAGVKATLVMYHFMHLKYESLLLRILVAMVFLLFVIIVVITFIDYAFR